MMESVGHPSRLSFIIIILLISLGVYPKYKKYLTTKTKVRSLGGSREPLNWEVLVSGCGYRNRFNIVIGISS